MADGYGISVKNRVGKSSRDEELQEEDVWAVVKEREDSSPKIRKYSKESSSGSSSSPWGSAAAPRVIPRANSGSHEARKSQQSSATVNVPDWSRIHRKNAKKWSRNGSIFFDGENGSSNANVSNVDGDYHEFDDHDGVEDDDDDDEMVPPHEYIARKLARSQISSFSMCEGIGRTLKGRDLSKVRNAILTKTGFLE